MNQLTGKLLVASPKLDNTMFSKTVVFMFEHGRQGSAGIVVNRPSDETTIAQLLDDPMLNSSIPLQEPIYHGGPVSERLDRNAETHTAQEMCLQTRWS